MNTLNWTFLDLCFFLFFESFFADLQRLGDESDTFRGKNLILTISPFLNSLNSGFKKEFKATFVLFLRTKASIIEIIQTLL